MKLNDELNKTTGNSTYKSTERGVESSLFLEKNMKTLAAIILVVLAFGGSAAFLFVREFGRFIDDVCPYGQEGVEDGDD